MIPLAISIILIILLSMQKKRPYSPNWILDCPRDKWEFWVKTEKERNPNFNWEQWEETHNINQ